MAGIDRANDILVNGDGLLAVRICSDDFPKKEPDLLFKRLEKIAVIIIVASGTVDLEVDYHTHHADPENGNVIIVGNFNVIGCCSVSKDFQADIMVVSRKFLSRIIPGNVTSGSAMYFPINNIITMRDRPVMHLETDEMAYMREAFAKVVFNASRTGAPLRLQLLYVSAVQFMTELMNFIIPRYLGSGTDRKTDRKSRIVDEFAKLLMENFKREHSVAFYADRLFISSQYLTKSTKSVLGVPAGRVIEDMLLTQARIMLRNPDLSMQQISSELGFSDQSSFGKFFRKEQGVSPMTYRKQL